MMCSALQAGTLGEIPPVSPAPGSFLPSPFPSWGKGLGEMPENPVQLTGLLSHLDRRDRLDCQALVQRYAN